MSTTKNRRWTRADLDRERRRRRRRLTAAHACTAALVLALVVVVATGGRAGAPAAATASPSDSGSAATVATAITTIPPATLAAAKPSGQIAPPQTISGQPLTADGKPQVLYVGAEYCPYCAATRWPLVVALSRFGDFTGLGVTHSSTSDVDPGTATLSFHGATYTSQYLSFDAKELYTNVASGNGYTPLDTLTPAEQAVFTDKTLNPQSAFPFLDFGGKYSAGTPFDPALLKGMTAQQIADAAHSAAGGAGATIDAAATAMTAAVCGLTNDKPTTVCADPAVVAAKGQING